MAATTTSNKTSKEFISRIIHDYPQFKFAPGAQEHWSPKANTITYSESEPMAELRYGLLHELAHAAEIRERSLGAGCKNRQKL
jgi:hypothetical protein